MTAVFILLVLVGAFFVFDRSRRRKFAKLYPTGRSSCLETFPGIANVGETGTCVGQLHPVGKVRFGTTLVDAITEGEIIDVGTTVEVIERQPNRIIVRDKSWVTPRNASVEE